MIGKAFAAAWLGLLLLCGVAVAQTRLESVLARGDGDQFWLLRTDVAADGSVSTSVRTQTDPVAGVWTETNRLASRILDAAPVGGRLAVLPDNHEWRLLWPGDSIAGPQPPAGYVLGRLGSAGDVLLAIATKPKSPAVLLRWTEREGWSIVAPLPPEAVADTASVCFFENTPWLSWVDHHTAYVARLDSHHAWEKSVRTWTGVGSASFVPGMPTPLLGGRTFINQKSPPFTVFVRLGIGTDAKGPIPHSVKTSDAASVALIGSSLRVVDIADGKIVQTVVDDYGRGLKYGPSPVPEPVQPQPQTSSEWANVVLMTILTMFMLRALRADSEGMPAVAAGLQIAPLWRRVLAGFIDGLPLLLAIGWVVWRFPGTIEELRAAPEIVYLPVYLGLIAYVGHVTASEICWGRSLGKQLTGLRVVTVEGDPVPAGKILLRNILRVLELSLVLPSIFPLFLPTRQRLGDLAAGTVVVKSAKRRATSDE